MFLHALKIMLLLSLVNTTWAAPLNLSDSPLFLTQAVSPLTMLVMGRDHKLYYEAYNDASDLNNDGVLDVRYNPAIDYFGYFDSYKCYSYDSAAGQFLPASTTANKTCSGSWSGDFLNYLTTSRIDALRKVLYGGQRIIDTTTDTVLQRANIPQDAHSWGKEYTSTAVDGFDISLYTPFAQPTAGNRHLFANTTLLSGNTGPLLRVALNQPYRIWEWVSIQSPVADDRVIDGNSGPDISASITDYKVTVKVCVTGLLETNCQAYPSGNYKPTGVLQTFGENDQMKFGLLSGSYTKHLSGGVVRKNISSLTDEIDLNTGQFTATVGIIQTIDRLQVVGFGGSYLHNSNCGFIFSRDIIESECRMWGNPIAEMMYETLRYYAGKSTPTSDFAYSGGDDDSLGLPQSSWQDPYTVDANSDGKVDNPWCAKPNMLVISDINPSYDTDQIPGSAFSSFSGDISLNASALGQTIWNGETGGASSLHFIGESGANNDGAPTAKTVTSFGNIRGLAPEEPNKKGGYYSASVAYHGLLTDENPAQDDQKVNTFTVALASPLPEIIIPVGSSSIRLLPFGKSVGPAPPNCLGGIDPTQGRFQPTNTIVDFYVENITPTSGTFRINFEDAQQGADHDMDAIVKYDYVVNPDDTVTITLTSSFASGCIIQHMGYVISGTTDDGVYLEVRDAVTAASGDNDYFLDTPPGESPAGNWNDSVELPLVATRTFTPSNTPSATVLKNPLWYAAKWGGFTDQNSSLTPDLPQEWDKDGNGIPDNYFLVSNALNLKNQLTTVFNNISNQTSSASAVAINSSLLSSTSRIYQATFNSKDWTGRLFSFAIDTSTGIVNASGSGPLGSQWEASTIISAQNFDTGRDIITYKPSGKKGIPFRWPVNSASPSTNELDLSQVAALNLNPDTSLTDTLGGSRLNYIRGSSAAPATGNFRARTSLLGDIINSDPAFVAEPKLAYPDVWGTGDLENSVLYSDFKTAYKNRAPMLYVGVNDGMIHAIDGLTGKEIFAYVPTSVFKNLNKLTSPSYTHQYYVDGSPYTNDVFFNGAWHTVLVSGLNKGGQGIFALNITNPASFSESNASNMVLWEFTDADDADLGYTYSKPSVVRLHNGRWAAIFGNGYNNTVSDGNASATGNAVLYIVDIETGALIKKIDTGFGSNDDPLGLGRPNGLSTPSAVDVNGDHVADYIYAGDLYGNLWKFTVNDANPSQWDVAFKQGGEPAPFFVATDSSGNRQPITASINVGRIKGSLTGLQIYFGTGKYLEGTDKTNTSTQTFYSILDFEKPVTGRSALLQQSILGEYDVTTNAGKTSRYRVSSDYQITKSHLGWFIDLLTPPSDTQVGERVIYDSLIRQGKVIFTTLIPSTDPCGYGGSSWLMELNAHSGSRLDFTPFDLNGDQDFSIADLVTYTNSNNDKELVAVSGKKSEVGITATPGIITDKEKEYKYLTGSSGSIERITENPAPIPSGRQSWRQIK